MKQKSIYLGMMPSNKFGGIKGKRISVSTVKYGLGLYEFQQQWWAVFYGKSYECWKETCYLHSNALVYTFQHENDKNKILKKEKVKVLN